MTRLVPVTILTGFLGSGKTTLMNKILEKNIVYKIAIVVNEFGDIKLESEFVKKQDEGIIELANGCVCCVARGDMISTLDLIMEKYPETEYILLEASGLSDPFSLSLTLYNPSMRDRFRLDSIVCVVDYLNFEKELDEHDITRKQISDANIVIISKYDGKDENLSQLKELINDLNKKCIIYIEDESFDPLELLDRSLTDFKEYSEEDLERLHKHEHEDFQHFILESDKQIDYEKFENFINKLDKNVVRSKGFINFKNAPHKDKKYLLQYVINRRDYRLEDWSGIKNTALLFIGKNLNKELIEDNFKKTFSE